MKPILICCDGAESKDIGLEKKDFANKKHINQYGTNANLHIASIGEKVYENLGTLAKDLINVASYIYAADRLITRGERTSLGSTWRRYFVFAIPVYNYDIWINKELKQELQDMLSFLSDDFYEFYFCPRTHSEPEPMFLPFGNSIFKKANQVSLFSGGLDSLAGVVEETADLNVHSVLVSHSPTPVIETRQATLIRCLQNTYPERVLCHAVANINLVGIRDIEHTQRTRSFLYLSLAAGVASQLNINQIKIYENGIVGLNLPIWKQSVGSMDTRTTHPKFLSDFQNFIRKIFKRDFVVKNPFFFKTKTDVIKSLLGRKRGDLIENTISCTRTSRLPRSIAHCGLCSQCISRRFAIISSDAEVYDSEGGYKYDLFLTSFAAIDKQDRWMGAKAVAVGFVHEAVKIHDQSIEQFLEEYTEVYTAAPHLDISVTEACNKIYDLQQRHAKEVCDVMKRLISKHANDLVGEGSIPKDSLIGIVASQCHKEEPIKLYAQRISALMQQSLPQCFCSSPPKDERDLQDKAQGIFTAADEQLNREFPQLAYVSGVGSKPDFSNKDNKLFIEFKYPRPRTRTITKIAGEMAADIFQFRQNQASVLFIIYDHHKTIKDRKRFCEDFEKENFIYVTVVV